MRLQPLIVLVLSILIHNLCRGAPTCPRGQILYNKDSRHLCCVPIVSPNYCGQNKRIQRCTEDGEPDVCVDCEDGKVNFSNSTSGVVEERCFKPLGCTEEAILSGNGQCQCDNSRCYYGDDEYSCLPLKAKCQENTYHNNGACVPCPADTHRPGIGCGPCVPMSSLAASVNTISFSEAIPHLNTTNSTTTVPTAVTTKRIRLDSLDKEEKDVPEDDKSVVSEPLPGTQVWEYKPVLIGLVATILIVMIVWGSVWFYRKRNRSDHVPLPSNSSTPPPSPPPSYAVLDPNRDTAHHSQINQGTGYPNGGATATCNNQRGNPNGGATATCNNQRAVPFQNSYCDNPVESPIDGAGQSFQPVQPSSSSIPDLPPTGFSSGSSASQGSVSVHGLAPDHTNPKVAVSNQVSTTEQQRAGQKPTSSVLPVVDDANTPLLGSAPSLDPDSIKRDSQ
ncbi:uncharacterized protein LOC124144922 isoform X2 [Haliotis rufescens]|uniref:uncharacterized protein LOC124144922 isoform X2 n=1 Tax=Haliotis rufescens TaxID=6454 RepID=UPI00201E845A|nr:uncharacterized protein LOC124144922 isoform X2 [Haliotis rufescens]